MQRHDAENQTGRVVAAVSPAPRPAWRQVLADDPGATALQTPEYFDAALIGTRGRDVSRLYTLADGRRLVLPLIRRRSLPGVRLDADFPGGYGHGGMLATGGLRGTDVAAVLEDLAGSAHALRIGGSHHTAAQWAAAASPGVVVTPRRVEVLDLSGGFAEIMAHRFTRQVRQNVNRAQRLGVEIEVDTTGRLARTFYDIYLTWVEHWVKRSKLPDQVARFQARREERWQKFATVTSRLGDLCRIFVARHEGVPVAGTITFVHGEHAIGWRSYSVRDDGRRLGANVFTQAIAIQDAAESGCRWFDLGQSGGVEQLLRYKRSMGAEPREAIDLTIESPVVRRVQTARRRTEAAVVGLLSHRSMGYQTTIDGK